MKKALIYIGAAAMVTTLLAPVASFGQDSAPFGGADRVPPIPPGEGFTFGGVIEKINYVANVLFALLVVITVIFLIWAAWKYLNGDADGAKGMIINAAVAIAIGLLSRGLPFLVRSLIGVDYEIPE